MAVGKIEMRRDWLEAWLAALRSGSYRQAREVLRDDEGAFSVLGVLCDLGPRKAWEKTPSGRWAYRFENQVAHSKPPASLLKLTGLDRRLSPDGHRLWKRLTIWNDLGWSFNFLADFIERVVVPVDPPEQEQAA